MTVGVGVSAVGAGLAAGARVPGIAAAGGATTVGRLGQSVGGMFPEFSIGKSQEVETAVKDDGKTDKSLLPSGAS